MTQMTNADTKSCGFSSLAKKVQLYKSLAYCSVGLSQCDHTHHFVVPVLPQAQLGKHRAIPDPCLHEPLSRTFFYLAVVSVHSSLARPLCWRCLLGRRLIRRWRQNLPRRCNLLRCGCSRLMCGNPSLPVSLQVLNWQAVCRKGTKAWLRRRAGWASKC